MKKSDTIPAVIMIAHLTVISGKVNPTAAGTKIVKE